MPIPENYAKAIEALQATLSPDSVTTDAGVLTKHSQTFGVSKGEIVVHASMQVNLTAVILQARVTLWWFFRRPQRMS